MPGDTYQHTHKSSSFANFLYQSSLFFLIFLISVVLLATGYDIAQQVIPKNRGPVRFSDTAITAGGYLLVGLASAVIGFSRLYTVRKVLASIPKGYLPLGKDELNKVRCIPYKPQGLLLTPRMLGYLSECMSASCQRVHALRHDCTCYKSSGTYAARLGGTGNRLRRGSFPIGYPSDP